RLQRRLDNAESVTPQSHAQRRMVAGCDINDRLRDLLRVERVELVSGGLEHLADMAGGRIAIRGDLAGELQIVAEAGARPARLDQCHEQVEGFKLLAEAFAEALQAPFGHMIETARRKRALTTSAGDLDDPAAPAQPHGGDKGAGDV